MQLDIVPPDGIDDILRNDTMLVKATSFTSRELPAVPNIVTQLRSLQLDNLCRIPTTSSTLKRPSTAMAATSKQGKHAQLTSTSYKRSHAYHC
jgi:hypothetical protein